MCALLPLASYEQVSRLSQNDPRLRGTTINFMNIGNIHTVRKAFLGMGKACRKGCVSFPAVLTHAPNPLALASGAHAVLVLWYRKPDWLEAVSDAGWLQLCRKVLTAANTVAEYLSQGHPVLVHCSDGWDRTPQVSGRCRHHAPRLWW